jgi:hypothetical protein
VPPCGVHIPLVAGNSGQEHSPLHAHGDVTLGVRVVGRECARLVPPAFHEQQRYVSYLW